MGATLLTGICPYGAAWRDHRRLWHQYFGAKPMEQYDARIEVEARAFAARLLENDRDVCSQLKLFVVSPSRWHFMWLIFPPSCLGGL
jgi:cytochrome P450